MKRPTWVTVIAVLMALIGGCGAMNDIKQVNTVEVLELKDMILDNIDIENNLDSEGDRAKLDTIRAKLGLEPTNNDTTANNSVLGLLQDVTYVGPELKEFLVKTGYIGLVFSALYIIAGLFTFSSRRNSVPLVVMTILGASFIFTIAQYVYLETIPSSLLMSMGLNVGFVFGGLIDIMLLIFWFTSDKYYFQEDLSPELD